MSGQSKITKQDSKEKVTETETKRRRRVQELKIEVIAVILIAAVVVLAIAFNKQAADGIFVFRSFVTQYFTWYLVTLTTVVLVFCLYMAFSRRGNIILGGKNAKKEYGMFAWLSMLFACGQGVGLIFWSVAEPILIKKDNPLSGKLGIANDDEAGIIWSYFHWAFQAWAIYCVVALCLALSFYNSHKPMTFRDAVVDIFPKKSQRVIGIIIEVVAILATVFGLSTSFAFAAMQITSGIGAVTGTAPQIAVRTAVVIIIGVIAAISVYFGIEKGMKRISELNSILSIVLVCGVFLFGPTLYILSVLPQTIGVYATDLWWMGLWTDAANSSMPLERWSDSWNGVWTVFIWCWCWAFSPFVGSFIARISKGRTVREFVLGVLGAPTIICVVWIGVIGGTSVKFDYTSKGAIYEATAKDTSMGLFATLREIPIKPAAMILMVISVILVLTYYVTSLDSGVHALAGFAASERKASRLFKVFLVLGIAAIAFLLLTLGGAGAVSTVQTGTILGAVPLSMIVILMMVRASKSTKDPEYLDIIDSAG